MPFFCCLNRNSPSFAHKIIAVLFGTAYKYLLIGIFYSVLLRICFTFLQWIEYKESFYCINDSIFRSIFFLRTGFHRLHVRPISLLSNYFTSQAMLDIVTMYYGNINEKMFTSLVLLDLAKAFDMVNHKILLYSLNHMVLEDQ